MHYDQTLSLIGGIAQDGSLRGPAAFPGIKEWRDMRVISVAIPGLVTK